MLPSIACSVGAGTVSWHLAVVAMGSVWGDVCVCCSQEVKCWVVLLDRFTPSSSVTPRLCPLEHTLLTWFSAWVDAALSILASFSTSLVSRNPRMPRNSDSNCCHSCLTTALWGCCLLFPCSDAELHHILIKYLRFCHIVFKSTWLNVVERIIPYP